MSDVPDRLDSMETSETESAPLLADKKIVFGARKPTEEAAPLTGIPLIIEAPFPSERTLQWWPCDPIPDKKAEATDDEKSRAGSDGAAELDGEAGVTFSLDYNGNTAVVVSQEVLIKVSEHVSQSLDHELGGFLLGNRYRCPNTPCDYVIIDQFSPAKFTESTEVRLAFTHEAWAQLSDELSGKFLGKLLIGWYHSHPRMDVFLSSHDMEIQNERFPEPWMVALVLEPEKHRGGFFCARDGRIKPHSPVDFFELLERNSRNSVIAWENYKALDPSTSSIPVLSTTNTASLTANSSQELVVARLKQDEQAPPKRKRRGRFLIIAILTVLLGAAALGVKNRKRVGTWLQSETGTIPPVPSPSIEQQIAAPQPTVAGQQALPGPTPSPTPSGSPEQQASPSPRVESQHEPAVDQTASQAHEQQAQRPDAGRRRNTSRPRARRR